MKGRREYAIPRPESLRSIQAHESLFNIVLSAYEFARLIFYDMKWKNDASPEARSTTNNAGRKGPTNGNTNGNREGAKPPGYVPESRAKVQDVGYDFSGQWSEIAGFCYLV
jgi:hypothetical protein